MMRCRKVWRSARGIARQAFCPLCLSLPFLSQSSDLQISVTKLCCLSSSRQISCAYLIRLKRHSETHCVCPRSIRMSEPPESIPTDASEDGKTKPVHLQSWRLAIVIGSLCLGIFLLGLDQNIIGVAIPRITTEFKALDDIAWYGSAYLLTITAFQPFFGNLYKYFNAKIVYLVSLVLFEGMTPYKLSSFCAMYTVMTDRAGQRKWDL